VLPLRRGRRDRRRRAAATAGSCRSLERLYAARMPPAWPCGRRRRREASSANFAACGCRDAASRARVRARPRAEATRCSTGIFRRAGVDWMTDPFFSRELRRPASCPLRARIRRWPTSGAIRPDYPTKGRPNFHRLAVPSAPGIAAPRPIAAGLFLLRRPAGADSAGRNSGGCRTRLRPAGTTRADLPREFRGIA